MAAAQFGVVSVGQLLALGLTSRQIGGLVAQGFLHRLFRGVFAVGHRNVGQWGWLRAASLAAGTGAFLSHRTSAGARGLREIATKQIELTVVSGKTRSRNRLVIHRTSRPPHPEDLTTKNGILISSVPRMFMELAATEKPVELERIITLTARKQMLDIGAVERAILRSAGHPGVGVLKVVFAAYRPGPDRKSELERKFDAGLADAPDIPPPLKNVVVEGGWELDNYWPEFGLDVETDGRPYHIAARDIEKDKFRDAKLLRIGIQTLRFTGLRIDLDLLGCIDDVRAVIAFNRRRLPAGS